MAVEGEGHARRRPVRWINVIFIPFNPIFRLAVLIAVFLKTTLGPLNAVYPIAYCPQYSLQYPAVDYVNFLSRYIFEMIYIIDVFLHIMHRQVSEEALKRVHLQKSASKLVVDVAALVPMFAMAVTEQCPAVRLWPNVLAFNEVLVMYRVGEYFSLGTTHSTGSLLVGYATLLVLVTHAFACFVLLLTFHGFCASCANLAPPRYYDWRLYVAPRFPDLKEEFNMYFFGSAFTLSFIVNKLIDEIKPSTYLELSVAITLMVFAYVTRIFIIVPKMFAEFSMRMRRVYIFHSRVNRIIEETKRRNPSKTAYISVENFFYLIWEKRQGITSMPAVIGDLPRYMRLDIRQDLVWPVFLHSPTFRATSCSYQRWLCEHIRLDYKLPGERFFAGPHCYTNLYYLKSGVVQFISADDSASPLLSVTGGTLFGDISFYVPPLQRRVAVRCQTYCEIFVISRTAILTSLHKFPEDRRIIMRQARERVAHARTLHALKQRDADLERSEAEGVDWLKTRWWEIFESIAHWKRSARETPCALPAERAPHHCARYLGQLVLCAERSPRSSPLFARTRFPWLLRPGGAALRTWRRLVLATAAAVLLLLPPNLTRRPAPAWFIYFRAYVDLVYALDILVSLVTSIHVKEHYMVHFWDVLFARVKRVRFVLDVAAALWLESVVAFVGYPQLTELSQFNRLLKIYVIFYYGDSWDRKKDPMDTMFYVLVLIHFCFIYIGGYFCFVITQLVPDITPTYIFGDLLCPWQSGTCNVTDKGVLSIILGWVFELIFSSQLSKTRLDLVIGMIISSGSFMLVMYIRIKFVASLYLKHRQIINYHYFVSNITRLYKQHYKIHPALLQRMSRYLTCHWKYFKGMDVLDPNLLQDEPYDIYWKFHGAAAERVVGTSRAFAHADPELVKDLARKAKFLILPKNSTLFLFGVPCKNVNWLVNGVVKLEYHDEEGELVTEFDDSGEMMSLSSVFLGKAALRTYTCATDCEVLYLSIRDFYSVMKRYPHEWAYIQHCVEELGPRFEQIFQVYLKKHQDYQNKLRERVFHAGPGPECPRRAPAAARAPSSDEQDAPYSYTFTLWIDPESRFIRYWMSFRMVVVMVSIVVAALQGTSGVFLREYLSAVGLFCDMVTVVDIMIKLFLPYYDPRGLVVSAFPACALHYLSRGFVLDAVGALPLSAALARLARRPLGATAARLLHTAARLPHLYLVTGYFNYLADVPTVNVAYIMLVKWQLVILLLVLSASSYFLSQCVEVSAAGGDVLLVHADQCWLPPYLHLHDHPTPMQLHLVFAESMNLAQNGLTRVNLGLFRLKRDNYGVAAVFVVLGLVFWYIMSYCQTLLLLQFRGHKVYQHGVNQLLAFLRAERVDAALVAQAADHFRYWWIRTKGLNIQALVTERMGAIFKEDLNFYFFKKTLAGLDSALGGGVSLQRALSNVLTQQYVLPGAAVLREMDLAPYVYVVHRGAVRLSRHGQHVATLNKGGVLGPVRSEAGERGARRGVRLRAARVSAVAHGHCDLLRLPYEDFHQLISDEVAENIRRCEQSRRDFLQPRRAPTELAHDSVQYLLRGAKTIRLPGMRAPVTADTSRWYGRWLGCVWLGAGSAAAALALGVLALPPAAGACLAALAVLDLLHLAHLLSEFYTMELRVVDNACVHRYVRWKRLAEWRLYADAASLALPLIASATGYDQLHLARLLRLHMLYDFHKHFCKNFQTTLTPILLKFSIVLLALHTLTCGWIFFACRQYEDGQFPEPAVPMMSVVNDTIDYDEWLLPNDRKGGCARVTRSAASPNGTKEVWFVVPRRWLADYIIALEYIIILHTHTNLDSVVALSLTQVYYKVCATTALYLLEMWISSVTVSAMYTRFRELYQYSYNVSNLETYLRRNGLSSNLLASMVRYTTMLWQRQKGCWLPELTQSAPACLREDLLGALYGHHLRGPPLLRDLPPYFLRQLVCRVRRIVIFPGKFIVQEGDIFPTIYFIHEGEVEKWYTDSSGESRMVSLLTMNGYFGLVPGLFPDTPYQFTYRSRTVVDLIYLRHRDWQDLLQGYPDIARDLLTAARHLRAALAAPPPPTQQPHPAPDNHPASASLRLNTN